MLMYYFNNDYAELFGNRIIVVEGDITDAPSVEQLCTLSASTVINCAALVKHFVNDDSLERINFGGVKNLIDLCVKTGKTLIQISTASVAGEGGMEFA